MHHYPQTPQAQADDCCRYGEDGRHADGEPTNDAVGVVAHGSVAPLVPSHKQPGARDDRPICRPQDIASDKPKEGGRDRHQEGDQQCAMRGGHGLSPLPLRLVGGLSFERTDVVRAEEVLPVQLHLRRNPAASLPVEDPLRPALDEAESRGELCRAAEPIDEGCVVHGALNTTFIDCVNMACINKPFSAETIAAMHASYIRLMEAAKKATAKSSQPVARPADLARHMNESPQRIHNWQTRGVSKEGALKAEALYGVSANHVLEGADLPRAAVPAEPPPIPPRDFADRREFAESDWSLLQDVLLVMSEQEINDLRERADRTRRIARTQLDNLSASAARSSHRLAKPKQDVIAPAPAPRRHTK